MAITSSFTNISILSDTDKKEILNDYRIANESRQASILGRREVLTGKAKFGIFGDGKEVAQIAMAKMFREGDWRSGYYRDQTFLLAAGMTTLEEFFSQLYGDTDITNNPSSGGRMMNNHYATRLLDEEGNWKDLTKLKITTADLSPTAGQMPRTVGLGLASKIYRNHRNKSIQRNFSVKGNEVIFATIGDSSTSEGLFLETFNAVGVLQIPVAISVWDDGYGISVPVEYQTTKGSISEALKGFGRDQASEGYEIYVVKGWDYPALIEAYSEGISKCRKDHIPVLFHISELTQPQGHSTSGSHERYKSKERLEWEKEYDCIRQMRLWMIAQDVATSDELDEIEHQAAERAKKARKTAWENFQKPIRKLRDEFTRMVNISKCDCQKLNKIDKLIQDLNRTGEPIREDVVSTAKKILRLICNTCGSEKSLKKQLGIWLDHAIKESVIRYNSNLYSESGKSALDVQEIKPQYSEDSKLVNGREILMANFDYILDKYPEVIIFGEDVGKIGGVNQTLEGMQAKYGELRVSDTGIREATIIGQGIGLALRGLRPIAEIQYFDYLVYALQVLSDDLSTLHYRTVGGQKAPLIISTRGHRLEGIWHSGSPMGMVINSIRGVYVVVPRNMTQAAGFYNTLLQSDDPAIIIETLNGYRLKERLPDNIGEFTIPLGKPEILLEGTDVTIVTYGSCVRIAEDAARQLSEFNISVELIDVQTLLPFDIQGVISESLKKTNKIIFFDEDVPGGATSFMMKKVLEDQNGYLYLDSRPVTVTAKEHRAAYSSDGDYFSNPNAEDVFDAVYDLMHNYNPQKFPELYPL
jgi:2-oxoisovalerate dehydrogenase E1 component